MPVKVSLTHGRSSRWSANQVFQAKNMFQSAPRHNSTSFGQTLYVGGSAKRHPSTSKMGSAARPKANYMLGKVSATKATDSAKPKSSVQYLSAGQSWCGFSRQQKSILTDPENQGKTQVQYTDCSKDGGNVDHPVCNIEPRPRGFPYLAKCSGGKCGIVQYGRHSVEKLNEHVANDQKQSAQ